MAIQNVTRWQKAQKFLILCLFLGFAFLIAGICCLSFHLQVHVPKSFQTFVNGTEFKYKDIVSKSYTNCTNEDDVMCHEFVARYNQSCTCIEYINITQDWEGDIVVLYELPDFNQSSIVKQKNYFSSRDDLQLNGTLSPVISEVCSPYDISDGKPIAPCGAVADAMFTDDYEITCKSVTALPKLYSGLLLDREKEGFRNPPPQDNLQVAFRSFSKPKHWTKNIWELSSDPRNNGFENEGFIAWMRSDLIRKPKWRLDRSKERFANGLTGLKDELCVLSISYNYPYSFYNGERKVIVAQRTTNTNLYIQSNQYYLPPANLFFGILGIVLGIILLIWSAVVVVMAKDKQVTETDTMPINGRNIKLTTPSAAATLKLESDQSDDDKKHEPPILKDVNAEEKLIVKPQAKQDVVIEEKPLKQKVEDNEDL